MSKQNDNNSFSIRSYFILYFVIFTFLITVIVSYFYIKNFKKTQINSLVNYGESLTKDVAYVVADIMIKEDFISLQEFAEEFSKRKYVNRVCITDYKKMILADSNAALLGSVQGKLENIGFIDQHEIGTTILYHQNEIYINSEVKVKSQIYGYVGMYLSTKSISDSLVSLYLNIFGIILAFWVFGIFISFYFSKLFSNPIKKLEYIIESYHKEFIFPSDFSGPKEIVRLFDEFKNLGRSLYTREEIILDAKKNIENLQKFLEGVINSIPNGLVVCDDQMVILFHNSKALNYSSFNKNYDGEVCDEVFQFLKGFKTKMLTTLAENKIEWESKVAVDYTNNRYADITFFPLTYSKDIALGILITDVTELVLKDLELIQAQKMESIGVLARGLAHDLNNVLSTVQNSISVLRMMHEDTNSVEETEFFQLIEKSIVRGSGIIKQLLSFSKKQSLVFVPVDLISVLSNIYKMGHSTFDKSIKFEFINTYNECCLIGDAVQLEQVFLNICINSVHAMTVMRKVGMWGGYLSIKVIMETIPVKPDYSVKRYWVVLIRDNGIGIPKENIEKIFDPFFSTKTSDVGSGLGLSTSYGIINNHGGFIKVESEVNKFTLFKVYLPVCEMKCELKGSVEKDLNPIKHNYSGVAIIVDDEEGVLISSSRMLQHIGFDVVLISDPNSVKSAMKGNIDKFQFLLMDIVMPLLNGIDVYLDLADEYPDIRCIFMSGYNDDVRLKDILARPTVEFLDKPFTFDELMQSIQKVFSYKNG